MKFCFLTVLIGAMFFGFSIFDLDKVQAQGACSWNPVTGEILDACAPGYHPVPDTGGTCYCVENEEDDPDDPYIPTQTILTVESRIDGEAVRGLQIQNVGGLSGTGGITDYQHVATESAIFSTVLRAPATFKEAQFGNWSGCDSVASRDCTISVPYGHSKTITVNYVDPPEPSCTLSVSKTKIVPGESIQISVSGQHYIGIRSICSYEDRGASWKNCKNCWGASTCSTTATRTLNEVGTYTYQGGFYWGATNQGFIYCPQTITVTVAEAPQIAECSFSLSKNSAQTGEDVILSMTAKHSYGVKKVYYRENGTWYSRSNPSGGEEYQTSWTLNHSQPGEYKYRTGFYPVGATTESDFVWCPGEKTLTITQPAPTNTLNVRSQVDGLSATGLVVGGSPGSLGGTTSYTRASTSTISGSLTAPSSFNGADFSQWTGCDSVLGRICTISVSNGAAKTATAQFTSSVDVSPECKLSIEPLVVNPGQSFRITVESQHPDGINRVYYYENNQYPPNTSKSCNGNESCTVIWDLSKNQPGRYKYQAVFQSTAGEWVYSNSLTVTVQQPVAPDENTLWVRSQVDNSWQSGAYIELVSGPSGAGNKITHYSYKSENGIEARLRAPATLGSAQFHSWSNCDQIIYPRDCVISVAGGGTETIIARYTVPAQPVNELRVRSRVNGVLTSGVSIGYDPSTQNMSGVTHYNKSFQGTIKTTLIAPQTFSGANFSHWSGCNEASGFNCVIQVSGGTTKEVTAHYLQPNTLRVLSSVEGNLQPGAVINDLSGHNFGGTTQYSRTVDGTLQAVLEAPTKHMSANFKEWTGCASVDGLECTITIEGGQTRSVEAFYEYGIPEWRER